MSAPGPTAAKPTPRPARGLSALRQHWTAGWTGGLLLVAFCLTLYLPGLNSFPPLDRDEARYAVTAQQMLRDADVHSFLIPHIGDSPRLNKPPLVYWLLAGSAWLLDASSAADEPQPDYPELQRQRTGSPVAARLPLTGGIGAYRAPAVAASILAVLLTWRIGLRMYTPACAWLAAALLAGAFLMSADARLARTDQILLAQVTLAQLALWRIWTRVRPAPLWVALFWLALLLGLFTKGPVAPGVVGLTILALCIVRGEWAWLRRLRPLFGLLLLVTAGLVWLVYVASVVGWPAVRSGLMEAAGLRGFQALDGNAGPPGYYLVLLPGLLWPGALLLVPALVQAFRRGVHFESLGVGWRWRVRPGRRPELFCLAWVLPALLVCELAQTKLPHYVLPLCPPLALLCARAAQDAVRRRLPLVGSRAALGGDIAWLLVGLLLAVGVPVAFAIGGHLRDDPRVYLALGAGLLVATGLLVLAFWLVRRRRFIAGLLVSLAVSVVAARTLFQITLPNLRAPWLSSAMASLLEQIDPAAQRPVAAVAFYQDSLLFLTAGRVERLRPAQLDTWLAHRPTGIAIVPADFALSEHDLRSLARVEGLDYGYGRWSAYEIVEHEEPASVRALLP